MPQTRVAVAQAFIRGADGGEAPRMMLRRELTHQLQVTAADRFVVGVVRHVEHGVRIVHGSSPLILVGVVVPIVEIRTEEIRHEPHPERVERGQRVELILDVAQQPVALGIRRQRLDQL